MAKVDAYIDVDTAVMRHIFCSKPKMFWREFEISKMKHFNYLRKYHYCNKNLRNAEKFTFPPKVSWLKYGAYLDSAMYHSPFFEIIPLLQKNGNFQVPIFKIWIEIDTGFVHDDVMRAFRLVAGVAVCHIAIRVTSKAFTVTVVFEIAFRFK